MEDRKELRIKFRTLFAFALLGVFLYLLYVFLSSFNGGVILFVALLALLFFWWLLYKMLPSGGGGFV